MPKVHLLLSFLLMHAFTQAQPLKFQPNFIREESNSITITADANFGNKGLLDYAPASDVYVHIGAITNLSTSASDWKYAGKFTWGTTNGAANAAPTGKNQWTFTITGGLRSFFGMTNANEKILKIAILFRSGNGSKALRNEDGSDMYVPVYDNANAIRVDEPASNPYFTRTLMPVNKLVGDNINLKGVANGYADLKLYFNDKLIASVSNADSILASPTIAAGGNQKLVMEGLFPGSSTIKDSIQFYVPEPSPPLPVPNGIGDGITYEKGDTSAYLVLYAPGKTRIAVIGDFNNWTETASGQMTKTPDGNRFWTRLTGLTPGTEYAYQFLIDGSLRIGDYNSTKVLDPNNDSFIPAETYPGLKPYPTGKTTGIVSVLQTGKPAYAWRTMGYKRPDKRNLIVYELLLRDFTAKRNFQSIKDTLSYLKRLGVNAIELMPVSEFEGNLSWGYNPNYFFALDKFYGTETAFKELVDACHQQGIAVILDIVMNHAFGSSPHALMYWDANAGKPSSSNPWLNPDARHPFNVGYDFNHESNATKDLVARVSRYWLTEFNIDGFRWDLSKGFTQTNNPNNVAAWGAYDAGRIATWKRIYDTIQAVSPGAYSILEHFAANTEEKELAAYGMLLWGNSNYNFNQATMGYAQDADFSSVSAQKRGWDKQHLIGYMESHDEERLMYKNLGFGNQSVNYSTRDTISALKRMGQAAAFWSMIPGPKMMWQFGELGFPYSINTCANGTVDNNCRLDNKPPVWSFYSNPQKKALYDTYAKLLQLRGNSSFLGTFTAANHNMDFAGTFKTLQINDDSLKVVVVGNFDIISKSAVVNFPENGTWFSYLTGTSININNLSSSISLQPGEYHVYLNKDLNKTTVTGIFGPERPALDAQLKVFPNPVINKLNLSYLLDHSGKISIELIDTQGRRLSILDQGFKTSGAHQLNIPESVFEKNHLKTGIYHIILHTTKGDQATKLIYRGG